MTPICNHCHPRAVNAGIMTTEVGQPLSRNAKCVFCGADTRLGFIINATQLNRISELPKEAEAEQEAEQTIDVPDPAHLAGEVEEEEEEEEDFIDPMRQEIRDARQRNLDGQDVRKTIDEMYDFIEKHFGAISYLLAKDYDRDAQSKEGQ